MNMKTLLSLIIIVMAVSVNLFAQTVAVQPVGAGTQENPYQIATLGNLRWLSETNNATAWGSSTDSRFYIQTASIDATETSSWNSG
jgi:hypothetical protein